MAGPTLIGGMWGTSNLALFLLDAESGKILESRSGPGIAKIQGKSFEDVLFGPCASWIAENPDIAFVLSGMIGSTIGWNEALYLDCPANVHDIADNCSALRSRGHRVHIAPGLRCINAFGQADVMRGEETEMLAWMERDAGSQAGRQCVCVPGTHSKWIEADGDLIVGFFSSVAGELFDVLEANGVLTSGTKTAAPFYDAPFYKGVSQISDCPERLLSHLFSVRANVANREMDPNDAPDFMSGLLIGADVAVGVKSLRLNGDGDRVVPIIAAKDLLRRYARAFEFWGVATMPVDASPLSAHGLYLICKALEART